MREDEGDGEEPDDHLPRDDAHRHHCLSFLCVPCLATLCTLPNKTCKSRSRIGATCLATCLLCVSVRIKTLATSDQYFCVTCEYYLATVILCIICYIFAVYLLYKILFFYCCNYFCWRIETLSLAHKYSPAQSPFIPGA
jgi:hypothetical protein